MPTKKKKCANCDNLIGHRAKQCRDCFFQRIEKERAKNREELLKSMEELRDLPSSEIMERLKDRPKKDLVEIIDLLDAVEKKEGEERAKHYVPNAKCEDFISMVGEGKTFISLFSAGNGVGKTALMCNLVANICFGPQNKYFDYPLFQKFPFLRQGRIIADTTTITEKIIPELKKWLPAGKYETFKKGKPYESHWEMVTGFSFDLMTYEQDRTQFESVERGFIFFDEPPPKDIYLASVGRARRGSVFGMFLTPLRHSAWIKNEIVDEADAEELQGKAERQKNYITASVWDNCRCCGIRGILEHKNIEKMLKEYPDDEREARAEGKFGHLLGRVHKLFSRDIHCLKPFAIRRSDYTIYHFLDPHPRTPDAAIWVAVDRNGQHFIVDELWIKGTAGDLAFQIRKKEEKMNMAVEERWIDPSAYTEDQHSEKSLAAELEKYGLYYQPGSKDLDEGVRMTNEALAYTAVSGRMILQPKLFAFDICERTIWEFDNYIWDEWKGRSAFERNPKNRPKDQDDHMMENVHRAMLAQLEWRPMMRENERIGVVSSSSLDPYR